MDAAPALWVAHARLSRQMFAKAMLHVRDLACALQQARPGRESGGRRAPRADDAERASGTDER